MTATLYWDPGGGALGGSGTWDSSSAVWSTSASGGGTLVPWSNGDNAVFDGTGATVNLAATTINAASIQFNTSSYKIAANTLTLASGGTSIDVASGVAATISSVLAGSDNLTKTDSGTLVVTSAATYTGGTTISAGTLQLGDGTSGHDGSLATSGITNNAVLKYNDYSTQVVTYIIGGTGSVTQMTGYLILDGGDTYTGGTTVSGGTIQVGSYGAAGSVAGNIVDDGEFFFYAAQTFSGTISGTGEIEVYSGGTVYLTGTNSSFTGETRVDLGTLLVGNSYALGGVGSYLVVNAGTVDLNGNNLTTYWVGGNGGVITDNSSGAGTTILTADISSSSPLGAGTTLTHIEDGAHKLLALSVTGTGSLDLMGTNTYTGGTTIASGSTLWIGYAGSTGSIQGDVTDNGTLVFAPATSLTYNGVISGSGSLQVQSYWGTGITIFTAAQTYTGSTTIYAGTLQLGDGTSGHDGSLATSGITNNAALVYNDYSTQVVTYIIGGTGSVTQMTGYVILDGGDTYTGGTTVSGGTIQVGSYGAAGSVAGNIVDDGTFFFYAAQTFSGSISGTGEIEVNSSGTVYLTGTNSSFTGDTRIDNGLLLVGNSYALGGLGSYLIVNGGTVDLNNNNLTTYWVGGNGGVITDNSSGAGTTILTADVSSSSPLGASTTLTHIEDGANKLLAVSVTGTGSLDLMGTNTYTGGTTIASGSTLWIGYAGSTGSIQGNVTDNGTLVFAPAISLTYGGVISGSGSVQVQSYWGTGVTVLTAANTYTGGTTIYAGALAAGNSSGSATGTGDVTLDGGAFMSAATGGSISGSVVAGYAAHLIEPGGTSNLTIDGLSANSNTTLEFNFGSGGTSGLLTIGGSFSESGAIPISIGTAPTSTGYYKIISGSGLTTSDFTPPAASNGYVYSLDTTHDAGYVDLVVQAADRSAPSPTTDGSLLLSTDAGDAASLNYNSNAATGQTVLTANSTLSPTKGSATLTDVKASVTMGGLTSSTIDYGSTLYTSGHAVPSSGVSYGFAVPLNASSLASGRYQFSMTITEYFSDSTTLTLTFVGDKDFLNRGSSPFGAGWNLNGLDALAPATSGGPAGVSFIQSDGKMGFFWSNGSGGYTSEAGPFEFYSLTGNWSSGFTLKSTDGIEETFNTSGQLTSVTDSDGNVTTFSYTSGKLTSIADPSHHTTSFSYTSSLVTTVTDFASRATTLGYTSAQLTSVTETSPGGGAATPETQFGYTSGTLTSMEDADGNTTGYTYSSTTGSLSAVDYADGTTYGYSAAITMPLANGAYLTPTANVAATTTDESGNTTTYTLDRFGNPLTVANALGNSTTYTRNGNSQVTEMVQPTVVNGSSTAAPTTYYTYDSDGNLHTEQSPDGSTQTWTYTSYTTYGGPDDVLTEYTDGLGNDTAYAYNTGTGDLLSSEQYINGTTANNTGQSTSASGDPITTYVYTGSPGGAGAPAGLVQSTTDPDGYVSAYNYDSAGSVTAEYEGQMVALSSNNAVYANLQQSPGLSRTYTVYVNAAPSSGHTTVTDSASGSPTFTYSGSSTTPLGSGWYELGTVVLAASDTSGTVTVNYTGGSVTAATLLEQTATTVYNSAEDPVSTTDGLNNISSTTYDNLDRPITASQGQTVALASGNAVYNNLTQSPGLPRTYTVYVNANPSGSTVTLSDSASGTLTYTYSGSSTTPLGSGWYELGTIALVSTDTSTTLTVNYTGGGSVTAATLLEQTGTTAYDALSNVVSQSDDLNRVTTYGFNSVEQQTSSSAGQIAALSSGSSTFSNVPETPGNARTLTIYVNANPSSSTTTITDSAGSLTLTYSGSSTTPLGSGWYELGTVMLAASDASSSVTVANNSTGATQLCLVEPTSATSYTPTGLVSSTSDGDGNLSVAGYNAVYEPTATSQGQTAAFVSGSATLGNLAQAPGLSRSYTIYVQSTSAPTSSATITDSAGSLTLSYSGSSTTPLGSGWYELGTVVLAAGDTSSSITVAYSGSGTVSQVALVEQTGTAVYDAIGRTTATIDALGDTNAYTYGFGSSTDSATSYTGQTVAMSSGSSTFNNLTLVPGSSRTFTVYVNSSTAPTSGSGYTITDTAGSLSLTFSGSANTPLGNSASGWYKLGTVTLLSTDASTSITVAYSGAATVTSVALVSQSTEDTDDADGNLTSVVDPVGNATTYTYNHLDQLSGSSETVALGEGSTTTATTSGTYDSDGNLIESVNANAQAIVYTYNSYGQETGETWYPTAADATAHTGSDGTRSFGYDLDGEMLAAANTATGSSVASYTYQYNTLGEVTAENLQFGAISQNAILTSGYDANGERTSLAANIDGTLGAAGSITSGINDFINTYGYDSRGDMTGITQTAQTSGTDNGVSPKNIVLAYNNNYEVAGMTFYASTGTSNEVAAATYGYNAASQVTDLNYVDGSSNPLAGFHWDYNLNGTTADEYIRNDTSGTPGGSYTSWGKASFTYDYNSQLIATNYSSFSHAPSSGTSESYDANGNRTSASVPSYLSRDTGAGNRMLFDGTYTYNFDANGNRTAQWVNNSGAAEASPQSGDTNITVYTWDNQNQLTAVKFYSTYAKYNANTPDTTVAYGYDAFGQMISRTPTGIGGESAQFYVNDGGKPALVLNGSGQVTQRNLYAPAVDQVLASEAVTAGSGGSTQSAGTSNWLISDGQGTVQDVAQYTSGGSGGTSVADNIVYNSFGQITYQSSPSDQPSFTFDGLFQDPDTGLTNEGSGSSWYDATNGVFVSTGAPGYNGSATNPYVNTGNDPNASTTTTNTDNDLAIGSTPEKPPLQSAAPPLPPEVQSIIDQHPLLSPPKPTPLAPSGGIPLHFTLDTNPKHEGETPIQIGKGTYWLRNLGPQPPFQVKPSQKPIPSQPKTQDNPPPPLKPLKPIPSLILTPGDPTDPTP